MFNAKITLEIYVFSSQDFAVTIMGLFSIKLASSTEKLGGLVNVNILIKSTHEI